MAAVETVNQKKGPSIVVQLAVLLVMTAAAVGIGWLSGSYLNSSVPHDGESEPAEAAAPAGGHGEAKHGEEAKEGEEKKLGSGNPLILDLGTITTNLAAPSDTWLRLELSVVLDQPSQDAMLAETIHQDMLAFMRTVKLHQIEGASGFQHLKADLLERASIRSGGHVQAVLIRTLLFE